MLGLVTLGSWIALTCWLVWRRRLSAAPEWGLWDALRGAQPIEWQDAPTSVTRRLAVVTQACERAIRSAEANDRPAVETLARAMVASARLLVSQLRADVKGYHRQARVLQLAMSVQRLDASTLASTDLRRRARVAEWVSICCGPTERLRLRLAFLDGALDQLAGRLMALQEDSPQPDLTGVREAQDDLTVLAGACVDASRMLLASVNATRDHIRRREWRTLAQCASARATPHAM